MIKYVLFDFDGTLADSKNAFLPAWNQLAERHGFKKIQLEDIENLRKLSIKERSRLMNFPMYKLPFIMPEFYRLYQQNAKDVVLFAGIPAMLNELQRQGYQIAVLSSNSAENIRELLHKNGVEIAEVLTSSRIFGKDRLMQKFLKRHRLQAYEVMYVGDEHRDIVACKSVGVKVIWVSWGYDALEAVEAEGPDYMAHEPKDILQILSQS